jgi:hypothetical protein
MVNRNLLQGKKIYQMILLYGGISMHSRIFVLKQIVFILLVSVHSCRQVPVLPSIKTGIWYTSKKNFIAIKFESSSIPLRGVYILCNRAESEVLPFEAIWKDNDLEFTFYDNPSLVLKGELSFVLDKLIITNNKGIKQIFHQQASKTFPESPYRYCAPIFTDIIINKVVYGQASGFYSSKPINCNGSFNYAKIILNITECVSANIRTDDIPLELDMYLPDNDSVTSRPLIILLHGGAFVAGDKKDLLAESLAIYYSRCGFVVASINYRIGYVFFFFMYSNLDRCIFKSIQDVRASLRYLSAHSQQYNCDPNNVYLVGYSAGGFLSLLTTFMSEDEAWPSTKGNESLFQPNLGCLDCSTNNALGDYKIKGVISMWGGINDLNLIDTDELTPVLLFHGTADQIVPFRYDYPFKNIGTRLTSFYARKVYGSESIKKKLDSLNIPATLITFEGVGHEPYLNESGQLNERYNLIRDSTLTFINKQLTGDSLIIHGPVDVSKTADVAEYKTAYIANATFAWTCIGGLIIEEKLNSVQIVWFKNELERKLKVVRSNKIGQVQFISLAIKDSQE